MPGPSGPGYIVIKAINGHRYRYRQWSWREPGRSHPRTKCEYLGPVDDTSHRVVARERSVPFHGTLYRGGGAGAMPKGKTAADVLQYEGDELGNSLQVEPGVDPTSIKSDNLVWLTETKAAAKDYGKVEPVQGTFRVVARDGLGGVLVEKLASLRHVPVGPSTPRVLSTIARKQVPALETELRNRYAASPRGPLKTDLQLPKPSPDDALDFGEEQMTYTERLATWQTRADEFAAQSKVEAAFAQVRAEFELSEPGYRVITDDAHQHGGRGVYAVPSTFPDWVPDHLRRKKLFNRLLADLTPDRITYPARASAHRQRALIHSILDHVDHLAGIDTSAIREKIMHIYGPRNTRETA